MDTFISTLGLQFEDTSCWEKAHTVGALLHPCNNEREWEVEDEPDHPSHRPSTRRWSPRGRRWSPPPWGRARPGLREGGCWSLELWTSSKVNKILFLFCILLYIFLNLLTQKRVEQWQEWPDCCFRCSSRHRAPRWGTAPPPGNNFKINFRFEI